MNHICPHTLPSSTLHVTSVQNQLGQGRIALLVRTRSIAIATAVGLTSLIVGSLTGCVPSESGKAVEPSRTFATAMAKPSRTSVSATPTPQPSAVVKTMTTLEQAPTVPTSTPAAITQTVAQKAEQVPVPQANQGGAYYKNCAEAKRAGAAPLRRGDPGYRPGLDRDGDGIACER